MPFEMEDIDPVCSTPYPCLLRRRCLEPLYECKTDVEIMRLLSEKMGMDMIYAKSDQDFLRDVYQHGDQQEGRRCSYDDFATGEFVRNPMTKPEHLVADVRPLRGHALEVLHREARPLATASARRSPISRSSPITSMRTRRIWTIRCAKSTRSWAAASTTSTMCTPSSPCTPVIRELEPEPIIKINAADAAARGIEQGDLVRAYNDHGYAVVKALVTEGIMPGVVSIPAWLPGRPVRRGPYAGPHERVHERFLLEQRILRLPVRSREVRRGCQVMAHYGMVIDTKRCVGCNALHGGVQDGEQRARRIILDARAYRRRGR